MANKIPLTTPTIRDWRHDPSNAKAWTAFAERYGDIIREWSMRNDLEKEEAEDMVQDVTIHMKNIIGKYDMERGRFRDWLKVITRNQCLSFLRAKRLVQAEALIGDIPDLEDHIDELAQDEILAIAFDEAKSKVPEREWEIFEARYRKLKSAAELSRELGISVAAVHQAKYRVYQLVKAKVLELDGDSDHLKKFDE